MATYWIKIRRFFKDRIKCLECSFCSSVNFEQLIRRFKNYSFKLRGCINCSNIQCCEDKHKINPHIFSNVSELWRLNGVFEPFGNSGKYLMISQSQQHFQLEGHFKLAGHIRVCKKPRIHKIKLKLVSRSKDLVSRSVG